MKKIYKNILIAVILSILLELCFFNFDSIRSKYYKPLNKQPDLYYETNFVENDGSYILKENETFSTIEIYNINDVVNNLYVDFDIQGETQIARVEYYISDDGNADLYLGNDGSPLYWNQNAQSTKYTTINAYGNARTLLIKIFKEKGETLTINNISLNEVKPFFISKIRLLIFTTLFFIISLFIGKYNYLSYTFENTSKNIKYITIGILIIIQLLTAFSISSINTYLVDEVKTNKQYKLLTDSLIEGRFDVDISVDDKLKQLSNPYDYSQRLNQNVSFAFDTAYYNGEYYIYFGAAPVVLYYLPFKLLPGTYLNDSIVNTINFTILSVSIILMLYMIIKDNFTKTPILFFGLLSLFAIDTCGALTLLAEPLIYTIPILCALAYSLLGLCLWIYSIKKDKSINCILAFLGSLGIGVAIGSRPQFGLFVFFALIIFFDQIKDIKHNIKPFICAIIPFIIVGSLMMYYNYTRFESPFDLGANYNLTFNDMTKRGMKISRVGDGLFFYLLQPASLTALFPYITQVTFVTKYVGMLIHEFSFGGLFFINPITILSLFVIKIKKHLTNKKLYYTAILSLVFGFLVVLLDTQMAGLVERYFSDISIYFIISSIIVVLAYINSHDNQNVLKLLFFFALCSLLFSVLRLFALDYQSLEICNPKLYYKFLILFWYKIIVPKAIKEAIKLTCCIVVFS